MSASTEVISMEIPAKQSLDSDVPSVEVVEVTTDINLVPAGKDNGGGQETTTDDSKSPSEQSVPKEDASAAGSEKDGAKETGSADEKAGDNGDKEGKEKKTEDEEEDKDEYAPEPENLELEDLIPHYQNLNYERFKNFYKKGDVGYIIQGLKGPFNLHSQIEKEKQRRSDRQNAAKEDTVQKKIVDSNAEVLHRVRIHSPCILKHLYRAAGKDSDLGSSPMRPQTFCRPFRPLVHYHSIMKQELEKLESRWGVSPGEVNTATSIKGEAKAVDDAGEDSKGSTSYLNSHHALVHMREYIRFMEKEVIPDSLRFARAEPREEQSAKVMFTDLWYLYREGDIVYSPVPTGKGRASGSKTMTSGSSDLESSYQTCWMVYAVITPETPADPDSLDFRQPRDDDGMGGSDSDAYDEEMTTRVCCYYIDYDGESYGPVTHQFLIRSYSGERDVTTLPIYPRHFLSMEQENKFLNEWRTNGEEFTQYVGLKHLYHSGWTLTRSPVGSLLDDDLRYPEHIESEVIVDFNEAFQSLPSWAPEFHIPRIVQEARWRSDSCGSETIQTYRWDKAEKDYIHACIVLNRSDHIAHVRRNKYLESDPFMAAQRSHHHEFRNNDSKWKPTGEYLWLLPRRLVVFALRERKFVNAGVRCLRTINRQTGIFDKLSIDPRNKSLVRSLVKEHFRKKLLREQGNEVVYQDLVRGKGTGLVFLLHGVPGVGKTATAEAVALEEKRPLFAITCGDLGFEPGTVEKNLTRIFRLANKWDCILLLDEAEIFFTKRTTSDLQRNALVSVFLRILEYYSGILFLTTNRVGILDEAFKSRIHVSLHYPVLNEAQYINVFRTNIERIKEIEENSGAEIKLKVDGDGILSWARTHWQDNERYIGRWNGRQIRNAFLIASSLAHHQMSEDAGSHPIPYSQAGILSSVHFDLVAETTREFDVYLTNAHGGKDDGAMAVATGTRRDVEDKIHKEYDSGGYHSSRPMGRTRGPPRGYGYAQELQVSQHQPQPWVSDDYPQRRENFGMASNYTTGHGGGADPFPQGSQQYDRPMPGANYHHPEALGDQSVQGRVTTGYGGGPDPFPLGSQQYDRPTNGANYHHPEASGDQSVQSRAKDPQYALYPVAETRAPADYYPQAGSVDPSVSSLENPQHQSLPRRQSPPLVQRQNESYPRQNPVKPRPGYAGYEGGGYQ